MNFEGKLHSIDGDPLQSIYVQNHNFNNFIFIIYGQNMNCYTVAVTILKKRMITEIKYDNLTLKFCFSDFYQIHQ